MNIGARIKVPLSEISEGNGHVDGTVHEIHGQFIGVRVEGYASTFYWTMDTIRSWQAFVTPEKPIRVIRCPRAPVVDVLYALHTPETSPKGAQECPPAPRKHVEAFRTCKPRKLIF
jgi:hypothetical protein